MNGYLEIYLCFDNFQIISSARLILFCSKILIQFTFAPYSEIFQDCVICLVYHDLCDLGDLCFCHDESDLDDDHDWADYPEYDVYRCLASWSASLLILRRDCALNCYCSYQIHVFSLLLC